MSYGAYITYSAPYMSAAAILAIDRHELEGRKIRVSFGTTKYCNNFIKGSKCTNKQCQYLHEIYDEEDTFTKQEISQSKWLY